MRKLLAAALIAASIGAGGSAWADPPSDDPSGGNGSHGNNGCQGLDHAPSTPGTDLARMILGCE
jgi:hypothetical protein